MNFSDVEPLYEQDKISMDGQRLEQQVKFIIEIDKLKQIHRQTYLTDGSRHENSVEHSWHLAVMCMLLMEHANHSNLDLGRVIRMVLVHDIVEIDAGDTFIYDDAGNGSKIEREFAAADRLFSILPTDQGNMLRDLWEEFESGQTPEARFANSLDRFQPMLHNIVTHGKSWQEHGIRKSQVVAKNQVMEAGSNRLWEYISRALSDAVSNGHLSE